MSTRANIIFREGKSRLYFYRHSDGYPSCVIPSLKNILGLLKKGARDDLNQFCGWVILCGAQEYLGEPWNASGNKDIKLKDYSPSGPGSCNWKVGAYEPTTGLHCDVEFIYEVTLDPVEIKVYTPKRDGMYKIRKGTLIDTITIGEEK
jgi:hypothetical protein